MLGGGVRCNACFFFVVNASKRKIALSCIFLAIASKWYVWLPPEEIRAGTIFFVPALTANKITRHDNFLVLAFIGPFPLSPWKKVKGAKDKCAPCRTSHF